MYRNIFFIRTTPFVKVEATLYEEYWGFYTGAYVAGTGQAEFYYTNPLDSASLKRWFEDHNYAGYPKRLEAYPVELAGLAGE